ncbi:MAG: response regulator [Clostridia bacterium]
MMKMRTILYAEDSLLDVEMTTEVLKESNILNPIINVKDGVEALEYLRCEGQFKNRTPGNPGMILLDLKMPRMDGLEFLAIVKQDKNFKHIPIVMLTSSREEKDLIMSYDLGLNAYVVKPIDFQDFATVVKQLGVFWAIINELPEV